MWKNLWRTNNLEQYRARNVSQGSEPGGEEKTEGESPVQGVAAMKADLASCSFPKVLITVRSELLSGVPGYRSHFLPFESQNEERNEGKKVINFFQELRFVPFGNKREKYMSQVSEGVDGRALKR